MTNAPEHLAPLWKTDVELDEENLVQSDPICNSEGCTQYLHPKKKEAYPINYGVPDFGIDHDIKLTKENYHNAQEERGHDFDPNKLAPDVYETEFELKPIWDRTSGADAGAF